MLRRAKSFINRTKHEDGKHKELDLSETSHLRRNTLIDSDVLKRQKVLNKSRRNLSDQKHNGLQRQVSRSQELLHDQVLEQIRRINFGDSYSKKDAKQLSQATEPTQELKRSHPAYISERKFRRKSFGAEDSAHKHERTEKQLAHHRTSGDVISHFDRKNLAYCSERSVRSPPTKQPESTLILGSDGDFLLNRKSIDMSYNFDRRKPAYVSVSRKKSDVLEKTGLRNLFQKMKSSQKGTGENRDCSDTSSFSGCSTGSSAASFTYESTQRNGYHRDDTVNQTHQPSGSCSNTSTASSSTSIGLEKYHRPYNSERHSDEKSGSIVNEKNIITPTDNPPTNKTYFDRTRPMYSSERHDHARRNAVNIGVRESANGTIFDRNHPSYYSEENYVQTRNCVSANKNFVKKPSADPLNFDRNHPLYSSERNWTPKQSSVPRNEDFSRKRQHYQTKPNFDRIEPVNCSERRIVGESRKKVFDRIKRDGGLSDNR